MAGVPGDLTAEGLKRHFLGREAYRRTRYVVARRGPQQRKDEIAPHVHVVHDDEKG